MLINFNVLLIRDGITRLVNGLKNKSSRKSAKKDAKKTKGGLRGFERLGFTLRPWRSLREMVVSELLEYSLPLAMLVEDIYMPFRDGITRLVNGLEE